MRKKINPYYNPGKVNLNILSFDEPNMSYKYNTLCFWSTQRGEVYAASDSGCSCPLPFENYEGYNQSDVLSLLERVGSIEQGESIFNAWNKSYDNKPMLSISYKQTLLDWLKEYLKNEKT